MTQIRSALLLLLAVSLAVVGTTSVALANTELVPGSRLVFPYIDISSGRDTFLLLTNTGTSTIRIHMEFYNQACEQKNNETTLTAKDIAAVVVSKAPLITPLFLAGNPGSEFTTKQQQRAGIGWVDMDVREFTCQGNLRNCDSIQYNGIMGNAVVIDVTTDFAFAYPAAASQGSAHSGRFGTIVTHHLGGLAQHWEGTYETFPSSIFVPAFFAESSCAADAALQATVAIAGPADAWRKESPGEDLGTSTPLVDTKTALYDGDENTGSPEATAHYINGRLCNVYTPAFRGDYDQNPPGDYATVDFTFGQKNAIGWLEIDNIAFSRTTAAPTGFPNNPAFSDANGFDDSQRPRGLVGILFQVEAEELTIGNPATTGQVHISDAIRLWSDPASQIDYPCFGTEGPNFAGLSPPTVATGASGFGNAPTCADQQFGDDVRPSWLGDNAETEQGNQRRSD